MNEVPLFKSGNFRRENDLSKRLGQSQQSTASRERDLYWQPTGPSPLNHRNE